MNKEVYLFILLGSNARSFAVGDEPSHNLHNQPLHVSKVNTDPASTSCRPGSDRNDAEV